MQYMLSSNNIVSILTTRCLLITIFQILAEAYLVMQTSNFLVICPIICLEKNPVFKKDSLYILVKLLLKNIFYNGQYTFTSNYYTSERIQHGIRIQHAGMRFIFNIIYIPQYKNLITNHISLEHKIFGQS